MTDHLVFIGTYTEPILFGTGAILQGKGEGIYIYQFDGTSGSLKLCSVAQSGPNPSYLAFDASRRHLYAVNELKTFDGAASGSVSAFEVDAENCTLHFLNRQPTQGTDPCHLIVDKTGKFVLVANYMSGSVCVLPIQQDGSLGNPTDVIQHTGSSVHPTRQKGPHAHGVTMDETGKLMFVPDLGLDRLMIYQFDSARGKLEPYRIPYIDLPAGAGPRGFVLHPKVDFAYIVNELNSTVTVFQYQIEKGILQEIQTLSTLPEEFKGDSTCGELQISPSGKFLYASNRGHNSIAVYTVNQDNGTLTFKGCTGTLGETPRHFIISPEEDYLLAANQDTDNVVIFRIDPLTGELSSSTQNLHVPTPVCVKFM